MRGFPIPFGLAVVTILSLSTGESPADSNNDPRTGFTACDSEAFPFAYEFDQPAGDLDLDNNSAPDWFTGRALGLEQPTPRAGTAISSQIKGTVLLRSDFSGSITRSALPTAAFTVEFSLKLIADSKSAGDIGFFGLQIQQPEQTNAFRMQIGAETVSFGEDGELLRLTGNNTDTAHTYRIATNNGGQWYVWRDDVLLTPDTGLPPNIASFNRRGAWLLGDFAENLSGDWELDYLRLSPEALAPDTGQVPVEPEPGDRTPVSIKRLLTFAGRFALAFDSEPANEYVIERSLTLESDSWTPVETVTAISQETALALDPLREFPDGAYYRVFLVPTEPSVDAGPVLQSVIRSEGRALVTFSSKAGRSYSVEASDSLLPESWATVKTVTAIFETTTVSIPSPLTARYFRARLNP